MENVIIVSEAAANQIKQMMEEHEEQKAHLRFSVHGGGCSGLSYGMNFDYEQTENDVATTQHGIIFLVDKKIVPTIKGTTIDYKSQALGGGFTIENPNAIATCGCGSSFRTKEEAGTPSDC